MKKKFLLLGLLVAVSQLWAANRTLKQAGIVAQQLLDNPQIVALNHSSLYVYNDQDRKGFVIVSASDKLRPVIGYSENGTFDEEAMPDNMRDFLRWVDEATRYVEAHPECALTAQQLASDVQTVAPLLGNIQWNQTEPFNNLCPMDGAERSVTGCVATAAAQCIYYHRYPTKGKGRHGLINFSVQNYNYNLMFDQAKTGLSAARKNEVAKLSYHCGVMADMDYSSSGSAAHVGCLQRGLVQNMGYDPYAQTLERRCYNYEDWQTILQNELYANRPIIYAGASIESGSAHCFVVDGIREDGLYHVNWGWGGYLDGYFDILILNPEGHSTGATTNSDGFSAMQQALIQVAPSGTMSNPTYYTSITGPDGTFSISAPMPVATGSKLSFALKNIYNYSQSETIRGNIGLAFCQNGQIVQYSLYQDYPFDLEPMYGFNDFSNIQVTLPRSLRDGTYQVYPCFVPSSGDFENICSIVRVSGLRTQYYNCTLQNKLATFTPANDRTAKLSVKNWNIAEKTIPSQYIQYITCSITNQADYTLSGRYQLCLTTPSGDEIFVKDPTVHTLASGESTTLSFDYTFNEAGVWSCSLYIFYQGFDIEASTQKHAIAGSQIPIYVNVPVSDLRSITSAPTGKAPNYNMAGQLIYRGKTPLNGLCIQNGKIILQK